MGPRPTLPGSSGRGDLWWCRSCPSCKAHTSGPLLAKRREHWLFDGVNRHRADAACGTGVAAGKLLGQALPAFLAIFERKKHLLHHIAVAALQTLVGHEVVAVFVLEVE